MESQGELPLHVVAVSLKNLRSKFNIVTGFPIYPTKVEIKITRSAMRTVIASDVFFTFVRVYSKNAG